MKKADISINKLILIILAILVLFAVLMFLFSVDILEWIRNLPQYNYTEDRPIDYTGADEELFAGTCYKGGEVIATIGSPKIISNIIEEGYIYYNTEEESSDGKIQFAKTQLYWKKQGETSKIILEKNGFFDFRGDILIAEIDSQGNIKVEENVLDLNSPIYQKKRFYQDIIHEYILFPKLDNSYIGKENKICKDGEDSELIKAWPENEGGEAIDWPPESVAELPNGDLQIVLMPYIYSGSFNYFYLVKRSSYVEIRGSINWGFDKRDLGRIMPDGSIWINVERMTEPLGGLWRSKPGGKILGGGDFKINPKINTEHYELAKFRETNLRINYEGVLDKLK